MLHMMGCFYLDPSSSLDALRDDFEQYVRHLKDIDLLVEARPIGRRYADTPMDTDEERDHEFYVLMSFRDRSQMDAAYGHIEASKKPAAGLHLNFMKRIRDPVFFCWEDV